MPEMMRVPSPTETPEEGKMNREKYKQLRIGLARNLAASGQGN